jgi:hypothetical protein
MTTQITATIKIVPEIKVIISFCQKILHMSILLKTVLPQVYAFSFFLSRIIYKKERKEKILFSLNVISFGQLAQLGN